MSSGGLDEVRRAEFKLAKRMRDATPSWWRGANLVVEVGMSTAKLTSIPIGEVLSPNIRTLEAVDALHAACQRAGKAWRRGSFDAVEVNPPVLKASYEYASGDLQLCARDLHYPTTPAPQPGTWEQALVERLGPKVFHVLTAALPIPAPELAETWRFLGRVGLPESGFFRVSFDFPAAGVPSVQTTLRRVAERLPECASWYRLGSSGDVQLCLNERAQLVSVDPNARLIRLVSSSVSTFAHFMSLYLAEEPTSAALERRFAEIDPQAVSDPESFWNDLLAERE